MANGDGLESTAAFRAQLLLSLVCELIPIICPFEPKVFALGIFGHLCQSSAGFSFEAQLRWII